MRSGHPDLLLELVSHLYSYIPKHSFTLGVRFWGPGYKFIRVTLDTDYLAFGDQGGADVVEKKRTESAMARRELDKCKFPFELISNTKDSARYSLTSGNSSQLEIAVTRFIGSLDSSSNLMLVACAAIQNSPERLLCASVRGGQDSITVSITKELPKPKKRTRKRKVATDLDEDGEIILW
jgi:hypothetical protein